MRTTKWGSVKMRYALVRHQTAGCHRWQGVLSGLNREALKETLGRSTMPWGGDVISASLREPERGMGARIAQRGGTP